MKRKSHTRTEQILMVMRVLAWLAFVGFAIQAGAILISFGVSYANPEGAKNLYKGLNLYQLRQTNFTYYILNVFLMVVILIMKAYVCYLVIKILSEMTLANPFKMEVAQLLEKISYVLLGCWVVGLVNISYNNWLVKTISGLPETTPIAELLFMAGLVFVISQVFKRGVEIQSENELTV